LIPLCTESNQQNMPEMVSDGAGGAIVVWFDARNPTSYDIYAQRFDAAGVVQWTTDGAPICTATGSQLMQKVVSDGAGGAIIVWLDQRSGSDDIYAQRVNSAGTVQWTSTGVALCTATGNQNNPQIVADGAGGAVITWLDGRAGATFGIYAQRVNSAGAPLWTADGVALCTLADIQSYPRIASDGSGGGIVTWQDTRGGSLLAVYGQRVDGAGTPQWTTNGLLLCAAPERQFSPEIVSDGSGGAIVVWSDLRNSSYDLYGQRVTGAGALQWTADGLPVCTAAGNQYSPRLAADGSGGVFVVWNDGRSGSGFDLYVQRLNGTGAAQWTVDGLPLCTAPGDPGGFNITSDGASGAILVWEDPRNGTNYEVFARRVGGTGPVGPNNGVALLSTPHVNHFPQVLPDGSGGAIAAWVDQRNGNNDIFASRTHATRLQ
jgi:hypothetical protein